MSTDGDMGRQTQPSLVAGRGLAFTRSPRWAGVGIGVTLGPTEQSKHFKSVVSQVGGHERSRKMLAGKLDQSRVGMNPGVHRFREGAGRGEDRVQRQL